MNKSVTKFIKTVKRGFGKRSPEILLGIGIASGITTTILAVKATPKALQLIEDAKFEKATTWNEEHQDAHVRAVSEKLTKPEIVKIVWKCYIPAAISGAASIACLLGSHSVNAKRNAALATAYKLSETALNEYREKVVEEIGEEKEKVIRDKVAQKHLDEKPVSKSEVIVTGTGKQLCYDGISGRYFESDIQTIRAAVNKINETMVYLWTRVTTTYTDNSTSVSYSVAKQGSTGATGTTGSQWYAGTGITGTSTTATAFADSGVANARVNDMYLNTSTGNTYKCTVAGNATNAKWVYAGNIKGVQGDKGNTGATGNGISKADITYASSSSNTSAPTSGWQNTPPSVSPGQYLWTKTVFTYTNGGTATQYSVAKQGNTGAAGADAITVSITSSNGTVFKNNSGSTVLTAHVYKGAVEQTVADNGTVSGLGTIKWYKVGSDTAVATAKTLTVSANDVDNTQAYTCQLEG